MKTISAKQFQLNQSEIMRAVAKGEPALITFHDKPWVRLEPAQTSAPAPGSRAALARALTIKFPDILPPGIDIDDLRREMMRKKFDH